ncbi:MAG: DUF6265 family protein [Sinimarinibacterium flocculans]|uniref:DUF6265 family protein n=1 Tax=Sinimarinibacterium flocculans TaxID=985250 RepID=UPI003C5C0A79
MHRIAIGLLAAGLLPSIALAQSARVDQFRWLAGCWAFDTPDGRYEEIWTPPTGNSMLGVSRRIVDGFTREFEYMRIVTSGGGGFDFIALPQGENATRFNSVSFTDNSVVFENPDNDFPNRVTYTLAPPDGVDARIEGRSNGQPMGINFPLKRTSCP